LRTGGYSDVDLAFEKKHSQPQSKNPSQPAAVIDEDSDDIFDQMMEKEERPNMRNQQLEEDGSSNDDANNQMD